MPGRHDHVRDRDRDGDGDRGMSVSRKRQRHATATSPQRSRWENGLDPELTKGICLEKIGAGLANLGNTCFLNSVLQCLTYTEPLAAYLQSGRHKKTCRASGFCAMCAIQSHVMNALTSSGKILAPSHLVKNLRYISRSFRISRQEDAHEYMVMLMDSMHKCCIPSGIASESPSAYEKSLVHKIFGGRLRSQVKCRQCSYCSNTYEPFLDLSLEIVQSDSLLKALAHFTVVEQLGGGEKVYKCERCKVKVQALKQFTVDKVPYILAIHLKRFTGMGGKINKKVEFGRTLNMKPFVSGPYEGDLKYTLYGVLVHAGWSTHSGHYYCFIRTSTGIWHALDDNQVYQVNEKMVLEQKAYMLFYVQDKRITRSSVKSEHKGNELKHDKPKPLNIASNKENRLPTSLEGNSALNSNDGVVSIETDSLTRKENLLDGNSASKDTKAMHNTKVASLSAEEQDSIASLSKIPSALNSNVKGNCNVGTKYFIINGLELQSGASIGNVDIRDPAASDKEKDSFKDLVSDTTAHGKKPPTHLGNVVAVDGHNFMKRPSDYDIINPTDCNGHLTPTKSIDGGKYVHASPNEYQFIKSPSEVHMVHPVTVVENTDAKASFSGDIPKIPQNHGNGTGLPFKECVEVSSLGNIELSSSNKIEGGCLPQKKDSNHHMHKNRIKFLKLVGHSKIVMPLSKRYLLLTALRISRKKRSFKKKKVSHHKFRSSFCSNSAVGSIKSETSSATCEPSVVRGNSGTNFCEAKKNSDLMMSSVQHDLAIAGIEKINSTACLRHGSAQIGLRQIVTQNGVGKAGELKKNPEKLSIGTCMCRSKDLVSKCNVDKLRLYSGANTKLSPVLLQSMQNRGASIGSLGIQERGNSISSCLNSASSYSQDACGQDRAGVDENAILQQSYLESHGLEYDRVPYEKKPTVGSVVDRGAEESCSGKKKKVRTSVFKNVMIYGNKRPDDNFNSPFQTIDSKVQIRKSSSRNVAVRNTSSRI